LLPDRAHRHGEATAEQGGGEVARADRRADTFRARGGTRRFVDAQRKGQHHGTDDQSDRGQPWALAGQQGADGDGADLRRGGPRGRVDQDRLAGHECRAERARGDPRPVRGSAAALSYHPNLSARSLVALVSDFSVRRCSAEHWSIGAASAAPTTRRASSSGPPGPAARPAIIFWSSCWTTTRPACNTK